MRKGAPQSADYSILFAEVQEQDLLDTNQIGLLRAANDNAIQGELQQCV